MTLLKVLGFSLALTLVFTLVANILPQVEGEAPVEKKIELGSLTMDSFMAMGEELFNEKCTLCHKPPPMGRAPDVEGLDMTETTTKRLEDERYQGVANDVESYLRESLVDPGKYVVAGWGQKGSNDTISPMPAADGPAIGLTAIEVDAVIAYLQGKDGGEVTLSLPSQEPTPEGERPPVAAASSGEEAITRYGCTACHAIFESNSPIGPALTDVGARLDSDQIRESIIDPAAVIAKGYPPIMPPDFADKMTIRELEMIVDFLSNQKG